MKNKLLIHSSYSTFVCYRSIIVLVADVVLQSCVERLQTALDWAIAMATAGEWTSRSDWLIVGASLAARVAQM